LPKDTFGLLLASALVLAQFLDPGEGPDPNGDFRVSPTFFVVLLGAGFLFAAIGHLIRSRTLVAIGVTMVFAATVFLPLAYALTN